MSHWEQGKSRRANEGAGAEWAHPPNNVFQLTAPAGALKIAGFLMNAFPIYRCDGRRVGS
jgi:hypothetical protein